MKLIYAFIFFLSFNLMHLKVHATKVYVTISMHDCSNCYAGLEKVKQMPHLEKVYLVFPKKSRIDSAGFIHSNGLDTFQGRILFNDSLYKKLHYKGQYSNSSISIFSSTSGKYISFPLVQFADFEKLLLYNLQDTSLITFDHQIIGGRAASKGIAGYIYSFDEIKSEILVSDPLNGTLVYAIKVDDTLILAAHKAAWGKFFKEKFKENIGNIDSPSTWIRKFNKIEHVYLAPDGKTIYALTAHRYKRVTENGDTVFSRFYVLNKYENGKLTTSNLIKTTLGVPLDNYTQKDVEQMTMYLGINFVITSDERFFIACRNDADRSKLNKFLAEMELVNGVYQIKKQFDGVLDSFYLGTTESEVAVFTSNFTTFDKDYFITTDGWYLRNLKTGKHIKLPNFNTDFNKTISSLSIKLENEKLFIIGSQFAEEESYYLVYDLNQKRIIFSKKIISFNEEGYVTGDIFFDDFDYSYIYLPKDANVVEKVKIYNEEE